MSISAIQNSRTELEEHRAFLRGTKIMSTGTLAGWSAAASALAATATSVGAAGGALFGLVGGLTSFSIYSLTNKLAQLVPDNLLNSKTKDKIVLLTFAIANQLTAWEIATLAGVSLDFGHVILLSGVSFLSMNFSGGELLKFINLLKNRLQQARGTAPNAALLPAASNAAPLSAASNAAPASAISGRAVRQ